MGDEINPNGNGPVEQEPQFTPEQEAAILAQRAQAEAMIRNVVTPMIEASNKAAKAEIDAGFKVLGDRFDKAVSSLGNTIPEAVDKCLAQRMAEAKAQREAQAGTQAAEAQVEQSVPAGAVVNAGRGETILDRFMAGLMRYVDQQVGLGGGVPKGQDDGFDRYVNYSLKIKQLAQADNEIWFQGGRFVTQALMATSKAGIDPAEAAERMDKLLTERHTEQAAKLAKEIKGT